MTEVITQKVAANEDDLNRDPISGTAGAHPLGTGAGAASGVVAGATVGLVIGGPLGGMIGAAVGAVTGGLAGKSAAEAINPTAEEIFWKETCDREPDYVNGKLYDYYAAGFRAGWEGRARHDGRTFAEAEPELRTNYILTKTELDPDWLDVGPAARAEWERSDQYWKAER